HEDPPLGDLAPSPTLSLPTWFLIRGLLKVRKEVVVHLLDTWSQHLHLLLRYFHHAFHENGGFLCVRSTSWGLVERNRPAKLISGECCRVGLDVRWLHFVECEFIEDKVHKLLLKGSQLGPHGLWNIHRAKLRRQHLPHLNPHVRKGLLSIRKGEKLRR